jgi:hypothetical protein
MNAFIKKFTTAGTFALITLLVIAGGVAGQAKPDIAPFNTDTTKSPIQSAEGVLDILLNVIKWVYTAFFIIAVLFILLAAYNFIRGGDNPEAVKTAKAQLKYAVIAIVIALLASGASVIIGMFLASGGRA